MRFISRTLVLLVVGGVVMGLLKGSRYADPGGFLSNLSSSPATVFEDVRKAVPAEAASLLPGAVHAGSSPETIYFSPTDNLERVDIELIGEARSTIEVAMYAFTDRSIAEALVRQADAGVAVYVYRDRDQFEQERTRGGGVMQILASRKNIHVRVKGNRELMHDKVMLIDESTLRGGSGNWSVSAARYQDNQVTVTHDGQQIAAFRRDFASMWNRGDNAVVQ